MKTVMMDILVYSTRAFLYIEKEDGTRGIVNFGDISYSFEVEPNLLELKLKTEEKPIRIKGTLKELLGLIMESRPMKDMVL